MGIKGDVENGRRWSVKQEIETRRIKKTSPGVD